MYNFERKLWLIPAAIAVLLTLLFVKEAFSEEKPSLYRPFVEAPTGEEGTYEFASRGPLGAVLAICNYSGCAFFLEPASGCEQGQTYPVLANSETQTGMLTAQCGLLTWEGREPRQTLKIQNQMDMVRVAAEGQKLALAFPVHAGGLDIMFADFGGLDPLLEEAYQKAKAQKNAEPEAEGAEKSEPVLKLPPAKNLRSI